MNVASLELCKELYELSGWDDFLLDHYQEWELKDRLPGRAVDACPKYDLGYLIWKLPRGCYINKAKNHYTASSGTMPELAGKVRPYSMQSDTPENAACKLLIQLFKQDILKKDGKQL